MSFSLLLSKTLQAVALGSLMAAPALGADDQPNPYAQPDESWISISGTVASPTNETFTLDYGDGVVTVEMDDWDWYSETHGLLDGDRVTVYGEVDDDLYEVTTIEAASVYVENLNSWFYASSADEEDAIFHHIPVVSAVVVGSGTLRGTVTSVNPGEEEFTIDTGTQQVTIGTDDMAYNPLDDKGYQIIEEGDRVSVIGTLEHDLFDDREFDADSIITLSGS